MRKPRGEGEILLIIGLAVLGLAVWGGYSLFTNTSLFSGNVPGSDVTIYPLYCVEADPTGLQNCTDPQAGDRLAYKIDVSNNQVVYWSPDDTQSGLTKDTDCTVVSLTNWSCNSDSGGLDGFGYTNGQFYDQGLVHAIYVSKVEWDTVNNGAAIPTNLIPQATSTTSSTNSVTPSTDNSSASESTGTLPTVVGACDNTTVTQIGTRLSDGITGDPIPGSGSAINYADGGYQVSYDTESAVQDWMVGDPIDLCFVSAPTDCPAGDDRGIVYQATDKRTGETWTAQNSEHSCGGA